MISGDGVNPRLGLLAGCQEMLEVWQSGDSGFVQELVVMLRHIAFSRFPDDSGWPEAELIISLPFSIFPKA